MNRPQPVCVPLAFACLLLCAALGAEHPADKGVELRGRIVCVPEAMQEKHGAELAAKHEHIYGLKTAEGKIHTILRGKYSEAIFLDERVRQKELVLRARVFPEAQAIEVMNLRSVKDGVVHDLHYFCQICTIYLVAPVVCDCCQGPVELKEEPLK